MYPTLLQPQLEHKLRSSNKQTGGYKLSTRSFVAENRVMLHTVQTQLSRRESYHRSRSCHTDYATLRLKESDSP